MSNSNNSNTNLLYNGYLHLPEIQLLLPPPVINYVDVHGFGAEVSPDTPGLLHGVINQKNARKCFENQIIPDGQQCTELCSHFRKLPFIDVFGDTMQLQCYIQMFEINVEYLTKDRQHQDVTINDILHSRLLIVPPNGHIWIILAKKKMSSSHFNLVNI